MKVLPVLPSLALLLAATAPASASQASPGLDYPPTKKVDQVDVLHGVEVADPYRWLEDDVRQSPAVRDWVAAQNRVTFEYLESIPERDAVRRRLTELWDYERWDNPEKAGGQYFFTHNDGLQNQSVLYVQRSLAEEPQVLLDPNTWSADGTVALADSQPSPDGRFLAYAVAEAGSDWQTWRVVDVASREPLADEVRWVKYSDVAWTPDGAGFFYGRYAEPAEGAAFQELTFHQKLYYHRVGTPQSADVLVYERPEQPEWGFASRVSEDGRYLVVTVWKGSVDKYRILVRDLREPFGLPTAVVDDFDDKYAFIGNDGDVLFFLTDLAAPRGRIIAIDLAQPERKSWREIVPQADATLVDVDLVGNLFVAQYLEDAKSAVRVFTRDGAHVRDVELPGIGSASGFDGRASDPETFYTFSSFATPPTVYRYDVATGESRVLHRPEVAFDPADYTVEQVFFTSRDGTRVPMFVAAKKGLPRDGSHPALLYGYGGFAVSELPVFKASRLAWMEMGGVYAVANLRGGGEYGEEWHLAGTQTRKQNVFDDFVAAAEHLVDAGWTRPEKLGILGGSNGGLLVGAVLNQRPDLFGAAIPAVGVMDMLRFHKFTAGRFWTDDYGSAEDPEQFQALLAYSPYHNLVPAEYPAVLVTTADTDDRVVPGHSFKYAARLQEVQRGDAPTLIRIETRAGHGAGKPTAKAIEETADMWAFLVESLGLELPAGYGGGKAAAR